MPETQATILEWARETFGRATTLRYLTRANEEMAELLAVATEPAGPSIPCAKISEEAADVMIALLCAAGQEHITMISGLIPKRPSMLIERQAAFANDRLADMIVDGCWGRFKTTQFYDLVGSLAAICRSCGTTLTAAMNRKMEINRGRQWEPAGDGTGRHVRQGKG